MKLDELLSRAIDASLQAGLEILNIYNSPGSKEVEQKEDNSPLTLADRKAHELITSALKETLIPILSEEGKHLPYEERKTWNQFWLVDPLDGTKEFIKRNGEFTVNIALIENGKPKLGVIYVPVLDILYFGSVNDGAYKLENSSKNLPFNIKELKSKSTLLQNQNEKQSIFTVVGSRSHLDTITRNFIDLVKEKKGELVFESRGSSLKLCLIAEGKAHVYPRFAPTMEWDIAAGCALINATGNHVKLANGLEEIKFNKENLLNKHFIAYTESSRNLVEDILNKMHQV
ncbi:MAG: 3'(2'),5'-bisphosphate nucleotidase CysQ [Bacteroidota bacterium]